MPSERNRYDDGMAVEIVNVRLQSGTLARIDELRAGTGLSRARAIELAVLVALRSDWSPAGQAPARELTESGLSAHERAHHGQAGRGAR